MPHQGQIVTDKNSGDSYEFLQTAEDTDGGYVEMKVSVHTVGPFVPDHFHVFQDETFEVISGELTILLGKDTKVLSAGEKIVLPKNKPHNHYNNNNESPVIYIHSVSPGLDFDYLIENLVGLTSDNKSKNGKFGLMQDLVTLRYLESKSFRADLPIGAQKFLMHTLAPIGHLLGYRAIYKKYSGIEK